MLKWSRASWTEAAGGALAWTMLPFTLLFAWLEISTAIAVGLVAINALFFALWIYGLRVTKQLRNAGEL